MSRAEHNKARKSHDGAVAQLGIARQLQANGRQVDLAPFYAKVERTRDVLSNTPRTPRKS